ncbi:MAG: arabinan endo-1,5-alpha-L-arabinosidase [Polyangiaceae bacterium]
MKPTFKSSRKRSNRVLAGALALAAGSALPACGASSSAGAPGAAAGAGVGGGGGAAANSGSTAGGAGQGSGTGGGAGAAAPSGGSSAAGTTSGSAAGAGRSGGAGAGGAGAGGSGAGGTGSASAGSAGQTSCPGAASDPSSPPQALTLSGNLGAHDPAAYVQGNTLYLAATGLIAKTSSNLTSWAGASSPLQLPSWAASKTGATNLWAPDISYFGGVFHLYYSASTFGSKKSCIGQATKAALESGSWADQGMVICSNDGTSDNWNAIDPNVVVDDASTPWLVFGSFWDGIKAVKLDSSGKRANSTLFSLAHHSGGEEGAWVFKRCDYYYLFISSGACCNGAFDYKILVGRSKSVTGPYLDKAGTDLMSGGGTVLVQGNASWVAPGHNAVIVYGGKTYNMYHALQGSSNGPATLRIAELTWDTDGWPVSGGP